MPGALNKYVLKRGASHRDAIHFARKGLDHCRHHAMPFGALQADSATQHAWLYAKPGAHAFRQRVRSLRAGGFEEHDVAPDGRLQLRR